MATSHETETLINRLLVEINSLKNLIPDTEIALINNKLENILEQVHEIKEESSKLNDIILNPNSGLVTNVNINKSKVKNIEQTLDEISDNADVRDKSIEEIKINVASLMRFRDNAARALWIMFTSILGLALKILFNAP